MSVRDLLTDGRRRLADSPSGGLEAEVLLAHVLDVDRAWLYANSEFTVAENSQKEFLDLVGKRASGEPVAYLTGVREFWSLPLKVTSDVLIPRSETELLVETALDFLQPGKAMRVVDLGTGSGAVALAMATERPLCEIHATEISPAALAVARENMESLAPGSVQFHLGSWLEPLKGRFDLVVSNPPYVAEDDHHLDKGDCRFEPRAALTPGTDSLSAIRQIAGDARDFLVRGGCLAFEHGFDQGSASRAILDQLGYVKIESRRDLENKERVTLGYRKN